MSAGRLIALEGIDGSGKSTQARLLSERMGALLTREPGGTELGRRLRALLLDPAPPVPTARTEALLMAADRAQHVDDVIAPALAGGTWVVSDRFTGSTLAYQGYGRGLDLEVLCRLVRFATGGLVADLSVLVDVEPAECRRRLAGAAPDRLEGLDGAFFGRVREGFLRLAADDPVHWAVVDGTGDVGMVATRIRAVVRERLGEPRRAALR